MQKSQHGFTLIELMITVAIVAILAAVAYPSYMSQVRRSHRAEGRNVLLQIQVAQEKYFLQNNKYVSTDTLLAAATTASTPGLGFPTTSPNGYYTISLQAGAGSNDTMYTATATATGSQAADSHCRNLVITSTGDKSTSTNADCWTR